MSYPIGDMLVQIKNAQAVGKEHVSVPASNMKFSIAKILKDSGMISDIEKRTKKGKKSEIQYLFVSLKYAEDKTPAISGFKLISRPSRHMYVKASELKSIRSGYGIGIISTSKGVMSSKDAKKQGLGGEMLFEIW